MLDVSDNGMGGPLPDLSSARLSWVNLTGNRLVGRLPAGLGAAGGGLVVLALGGNAISGGAWPPGGGGS